MTAGPVAGDYFNVSVEEGFGNWLEFGFTRASHSDGGTPVLSSLFNYAGINIFNGKAKVVSENAFHAKWVPAIAVGGALRTNVPYISQYIAHTNATNGDVYATATKVFLVKRRLPILLNGGARGTNAEVYGYAGNATHWQARAFGAIGFPIPFRKVLIAPVVEVDQEPHRVAYLPIVSVPTTLIYAVRVSDYPSMKWSIDVGTGHVAGNVAPGINLRADNAVALALDYRF